MARSSFGLGRRRQVGHLVEKQRAAVRRLELAAPAADAGRRAILDAEQLRLEQRIDQRRAVDGDERSVAAAAQVVDLARHELLADAGLAFQKDGEVRRGDVAGWFRADGPSPASSRSTARPRRGACAPSAAVPRARKLHAKPLDLEDQRADVSRGVENLKIPFTQTAAGIEGGLELTGHRWIGTRNVRTIDSMGASIGASTGDPSAAAASIRPAHRLPVSRNWTDRTGTARRRASSNSPRISEISSWRSSDRASVANRSPSARRRSRCRGSCCLGVMSSQPVE